MVSYLTDWGVGSLVPVCVGAFLFGRSPDSAVGCFRQVRCLVVHSSHQCLRRHRTAVGCGSQFQGSRPSTWNCYHGCMSTDGSMRRPLMCYCGWRNADNQRVPRRSHWNRGRRSRLLLSVFQKKSRSLTLAFRWSGSGRVVY